MLRPSPVPSPIGLVVKNGSNTREATSGSIPVPVSASEITTYSPGSRMPSSRPASTEVARASSDTLPPSGMASRALTARLTSALSNWLGSTSALSGVSAMSSSSVMFSANACRMSLAACVMRLRISRHCGASGCWRAKDSSRLVSSAPLRAAFWINSSSSRTSARGSSSSSISVLPMMIMSMLLKSCATPPVSLPSASSDWFSRM